MPHKQMNSGKTQLHFRLIIIFILLVLSCDFVNANSLQKDTVVDYLLKNKRYQRADQLLKRKLKQGDSLDNDDALSIYNKLIITQIKIGSSDSSAIFCRKALRLSKQTKDSILIAETYKNLGAGYKNNNQVDSAIYYTQMALGLNYRFKNSSGVISCLNTLGVIYNYLENPKLALSFYLKARGKIIDNDDQNSLAINNYNIGLIYFRLKDYDKTLKYFLEAESKAYKVENFHLLIYVYGSMSDVFLAQGDEIKWEEYSKKAISLTKNFGNRQSYLLGLCNLTSHAIKKDDFEKALNYANIVLNQLKSEDNLVIRKRITELLYKTYKQNGDFKNALIYLEKKNSLADTILNKSDIDQIVKIIEKYESANEISQLNLYLIIAGILLSIVAIGLLFKFQKNKKSVLDPDKEAIGKNSVKDKYFLIYNKLILLLEKEEVYKDANLKQDDIVRKLYTNKKYLYYSLKECGNTSFKGLINKYRIDHSKKLIEESVQNSTRLIFSEIYKECGFTTNESFYRIFKTHTQLTPGEYLQAKIKKTSDIN